MLALGGFSLVCECVLSHKGLRKIKGGTKAVVRSRFDELHAAGRTLILGWKQRATPIDCSDRDSFEPFIFGWIAFNGWASCVTESEGDTEIMETLVLDSQLAQDFTSALSGDFEVAMRDFHLTWPIFRADSQSYVADPRLTRSEVVERYKEEGGLYRPACAFRHELGEQIPLDWPHMISAIYQVRCNLFHGHKGLHCENDIEIVSKAHRALAHLLRIAIPSRLSGE